MEQQAVPSINIAFTDGYAFTFEKVEKTKYYNCQIMFGDRVLYSEQSVPYKIMDQYGFISMVKLFKNSSKLEAGKYKCKIVAIGQNEQIIAEGSTEFDLCRKQAQKINEMIRDAENEFLKPANKARNRKTWLYIIGTVVIIGLLSLIPILHCLNSKSRVEKNLEDLSSFLEKNRASALPSTLLSTNVDNNVGQSNLLEIPRSNSVQQVATNTTNDVLTISNGIFATILRNFTNNLAADKTATNVIPSLSDQGRTPMVLGNENVFINVTGTNHNVNVRSSLDRKEE